MYKETVLLFPQRVQSLLHLHKEQVLFLRTRQYTLLQLLFFQFHLFLIRNVFAGRTICSRGGFRFHCLASSNLSILSLLTLQIPSQLGFKSFEFRINLTLLQICRRASNLSSYPCILLWVIKEPCRQHSLHVLWLWLWLLLHLLRYAALCCLRLWWHCVKESSG